MSSPGLFVSPHVTPEPPHADEQKTIGLQLWYDLNADKEMEAGCGPWELAVPSDWDLDKCVLGPCAHGNAKDKDQIILEHARALLAGPFTLNFQRKGLNEDETTKKLVLGFVNENKLKFSSLESKDKLALLQAWNTMKSWYGWVISHGEVSLCEFMCRSAQSQLETAKAQSSPTDHWVTEAKAHTKRKRDVEAEQERLRAAQKNIHETKISLAKDEAAIKQRRKMLTVAECHLKEDEARLAKMEAELKESQKRADEAEERALPGFRSRKGGKDGKEGGDSSIDLTQASDGEEVTASPSKRVATAKRSAGV